jgi:hypothetical protein
MQSLEPEVNKFRPLCFCAILFVLSLLFLASGLFPAQSIESIGSEHVRLRMPAEREALGRDLAAELERCYIFMNRATGQSLPRKVLIVVSWDQSESSCNWQNAAITVGMNQPAASADVRTFLLHNAGREMARLGLLNLSGGAQREDTEFLFEGMIEIFIHEFEHNSRGLEAAWEISKFLDEMKLLGVATQRSWNKFSSGKRCFRNAAPGITLLTTYREMQGRETPLKLFESLKKSSLTASLSSAFKAPTAEIENTWLKRVREYQPGDEITIAADDIPRLLQTAIVPGSAMPGTTVELQLSFKDRYNNLLPNGVFVRDERSGSVIQADAASEPGSGVFVVKIPIDPNCSPGEYKYQVTAIDETGNLRRYSGSYRVAN